MKRKIKLRYGDAYLQEEMDRNGQFTGLTDDMVSVIKNQCYRPNRILF